MGHFPSIFVETIFGFLALFVLTKVLGKSQITQLTAFDFISAVILGELVGNALFDDKSGIKEIAFAVAVWGVLLYTTEIITQKFKRTRGLLEGMPAIVIKDGKLQREQMKKNKLDINQLQHLLRDKGAFSVSEVAYAILETDGGISVLKKSDSQNLTRSDLNLESNVPTLPVTVITDGEILWDNLKEKQLDEQWLHNQLKQQNVASPKDVFYAEWKQGEKLHIHGY
ncbi:DUF421 domain-containing protein [Sediminibacillus massiliensis]|uniref:DUF421 domain-containing protein n=1 Tax=Sediminibacillus massiliensis TaxID=1926277 RepID=UPI00098878F5|nr:DUF421 domain-containing protein [Sediminibacillus massiliensis]